MAIFKEDPERGERGASGSGERRDPILSMPHVAGGGAGSDHDHAPIRIARWLRAANKIVHVQAQRDSQTEGGHGRATGAHACWGWMVGAQKAEAVGARRSPIAVVEAEAVAGSEEVSDLFSGSERVVAAREALIYCGVEAVLLVHFHFSVSDF